MHSITVFCGSNSGTDPVFTNQAFALGKTLAQLNIRLVYGGAKIGMMGAVAEGVLSAGGKVIGVIPWFLRKKEVAHENLTELIVVESMHERKMKMHELSDGVIALPGGFGTLEELFEMLTWAQLGLHQKPIGILNIAGFYDALCAQIQTMSDQEFLKESNQKMLLVSDRIEDLLAQMENYVAPEVGKWIEKEDV
ncbi:MAG: TIGR00730 family Rossman fold protein [Saprospiraceae bacterium]|nr:TIGR00730 family Rossman fold protein [Saprospiraceae bacterium]MDZ4705487.1 TIGR00730 family Rossman fold protein [Saprospiraceae bacterium]